MSIRSVVLAALVVPTALVACAQVHSDLATAQVPGEAVRALGVAGYERFSEAPLGALLLDAEGEVRGEAVRTGEGVSLGFELVDAEGRSIEHSLGGGDAPWLKIDGQPATSPGEDRGIALLRAIALDPAFHALASGEAATGDAPALGEAQAALRMGAEAGNTGRQKCYEGCSVGHLDCLAGARPEGCNDVYTACIDACALAYPTRIRVSTAVVVGRVTASAAR